MDKILAIMTVVQQLVALGIQFGPELIAALERVFEAAKALITGQPLTDAQLADIDAAFEAVNAALDAAEQKQEANAAAAGCDLLKVTS